MRIPVLLFVLLSSLAHAQTATRYTLVANQSTLQWRGENLLGSGHEGTIQISSGDLTVENTVVKKGVFVIDMNTIRNTDMKDAGSQRDLEEHLKGDDFFAVSKFPQAMFSILKLTTVFGTQDNFILEGLLSIRGISQPVKFPATITRTTDLIHAKADIVIDRLQWNITYESKTIFTSLKDGAIKDQIQISVDLTFKR
jgi:polyisoprenoid-binding protein YceI